MSKQEGFSLIEVLTALSVFSIAALPLAQLSAQTLRGASQLDWRALARVEADSLLAEFSLLEGVSTGMERTGQSIQRGHALDWHVTARSSEIPGVIILTANVSSHDTGQVLATRYGLAADKR